MRTLLIASAMLLLAASDASTPCYGNSCGPPMLTEVVGQADVVLHVSRKSLHQGVWQRDPDWTPFEVVEVHRGDRRRWPVGKLFAIPHKVEGKPGQHYLLMGKYKPDHPTGRKEIVWSRRTLPPAVWQYAQGVALAKSTSDRLKVFIAYLEHADERIASDAFMGVSLINDVTIDELKKLADVLPRERLLGWLQDPETSQNRKGLYGIMLGICGKREDAAVFQRIITTPTEECWSDAGGLEFGYLLLTGERGLKVIEDHKFKLAKGPFPGRDTHAAMEAVQFMWEQGDGKISRERLRQSIRLLLDQQRFRDLAIDELARFEDWSIRDDLMKRYGTKGYEKPRVKKSIIRYLLTCANDKTEDNNGNPDKHVMDARDHLKQLRQVDPGLVKKAESGFFLLK